MLRLVLVPVFAWSLLHAGGDRNSWRIAAASVFVLAVLTDGLDGDLARRHGLITDFGKIIDPMADKALIGTALVGLSLLGELPWWVTAVVLVREVAVTVIRLVVLRYGVMAAGRGGKAKTAFQALAITLFLLPVQGTVGNTVANGVMALAVVLTVVSGLDYTLQAYRLRTRSIVARRIAARRDAAPPEVTESSPTGPDGARIEAVEAVGDGGRDGEPRGTVPA
jgi:CDP-diacylglycerol--glycerol-3-phosphate 3-phosphatidyltransferase